MSDSVSPLPSFHDLALSEPILKVLDVVGYETPSPIQAKMIPYILAGKDVIGQAQTGTGKTAAFALPLLSKIDLNQKQPQVLVLAPTRELAIQVAEAFQRYASQLKGFHVLPIYGGQDYSIQLRQLRRGTHVVVGTPGRVMDHMRRGTLKLSALKCLVLDEADEMLQMGFIDDVEWVLEKTPQDRQIALFSATMPQIIRKIAQKHLRNPQEVTIKVKTVTASTIRQRYWFVSGLHKLDALTRMLEVEPFEGMIIFVRTKTATVELAEKLEARGYSAAAINGDLSQALRERTIDNLKKGRIDILVATDVAARGLDVERISHVINYDIPYDTEAYIHRIGRTGRAGRVGDAILFVSPREKRLLNNIERATKQKVEEMQLPSTEVINNTRVSRFKQRISDTLSAEELGFYTQLIEQYEHEHNIPAIEIAAALAHLLQGNTPLLLKNPPKKPRERTENKESKRRDRKPRERRETDINMELFRIEVGHSHGVKPGNIVGAIANEAGIEGQHIASIKIEENYSTVELPAGMPKELFQSLKKIRVAGRALKISHYNEEAKKKSKRKKRVSSTSKRGKEDS
jgi:ATP-dependent RNA helicase DeaD